MKTPCGLCGGSDFDGVLDGWDRLCGIPGRFRVLRCRGCGLLATRPVPANLGDYYPAGYGPHHIGKGCLDGLKSFLMQRFVLRALGRGEGLKILDVGCANGQLLAKLKRPGWRLSGLEPDADCVSRVRSGLGVDARCGVLADRAFEPGFDVITMFHVLEHVPDPVADLREVRRLLKPDGVFIAEVPVCDSYGFAIMGSKWYGLDLPRHLTHFSTRTLRLAAEKAGLRVKSISRAPFPAMDLAMIAFPLAARGGLRVACYAPAWLFHRMFRGGVARMVAVGGF